MDSPSVIYSERDPDNPGADIPEIVRIQILPARIISQKISKINPELNLRIGNIHSD
jgi:hypothetical protein